MDDAPILGSAGADCNHFVSRLIFDKTPVYDWAMALEPGSAMTENVQLRNDAAVIAVDMLTKLVATTCELFGGPVSIYESFDPEFREDTYTVFSVATHLNPKEAVKAEQEWIRRVEAIAPRWKDLRLSIHSAQ